MQQIHIVLGCSLLLVCASAAVSRSDQPEHVNQSIKPKEFLDKWSRPDHSARKIEATADVDSSEKDPINRFVVGCSSKELAAISEQEIRTYLQNGGEISQLHALLLLARKGAPDALERTRELVLKSPNGFVRAIAASCLGLSKKATPAVIAVLEKALSDPFTEESPNSDVSIALVQQSAIGALMDLGTKPEWDAAAKKWTLRDMTEEEKQQWKKRYAGKFD